MNKQKIKNKMLELLQERERKEMLTSEENYSYKQYHKGYISAMQDAISLLNGEEW